MSQSEIKRILGEVHMFWNSISHFQWPLQQMNDCSHPWK